MKFFIIVIGSLVSAAGTMGRYSWDIDGPYECFEGWGCLYVPTDCDYKTYNGIKAQWPYYCRCDSGWWLEYDDPYYLCINKNECLAKTDNCHEFATCTDTPGSFTCECLDGYRGDGINTCVEINQCAEKTDECDEFATCSNNSLGTYTCECFNGYRGDGFKCKDIDECAEKNHTCDTHATCGNTVGSYDCACNDGWLADDNFNCVNIDECAEQSDNCHEFSACLDTPGSFECDCFDGYRGDGINTCDEIDECAEEADDCHEFATCSNTPLGSYSCECLDGYEGDGFNCSDIDECDTGLHKCHELGFCSNKLGSYECTCNDGYLGDGFLCTVPCATFYDNAIDGFLTNTSAFTTGTFDVSNLETFSTTPSQTDQDNWKPKTGFNNKASFVSVQPKCTLKGYTGFNFQGKKLGEWNGEFFF